MNVSIMRQNLLRAYPKSKSWAEKVKKMSDQQVVAIHHRMSLAGKL